MNFKKIISIFLIYINLLSNVSAGIYISKVMPNTIDDANLEYIELTNSGELLESLSGYILIDKSQKQFIFGSGIFLESLESKKIFRPETKILLNNSDEELYLYDNYGDLVDSIIYNETEKGVAITSPQPSPSQEREQEQDTFSGGIDEGTGIIETSSGNIDEGTGIIEINSGELEEGTGIIETNSGGVEEGTGIIETSSGNIDEGTGIIETSSGEIEEELLKFDIVYNFQSPTYLLEKDEIEDTYNCDSSKEECKINLDFRNTFTGGLKEGDYECILDFGFGSGILNGEENKCNPSSFVVPVGKFEFNFLIKNKINSGIFSTGSFNVINGGYIKPVETIKFYYPSNSSNYVTPITKIAFNNPEIIIQSGLGDNNLCKNKDCKINLNYIPESSNFSCEWDFDGGTFETRDTDKKCNPGYVYYGIGDYKVRLRVYQKNLVSNFKEAYLEFSNNENIEKLDYIDENNNGKIELLSGKILDEGSGTLLIKLDLEQDNKQYLDYIEDSFSIGYRKLKSGLKIFGKTIPNVDVFINIKEKQKISFINLFVNKANADYIYNTKSDNEGNYEFLLTEINAGDIEVNTRVVDNFGNEVNISKTKKISIDEDYVTEMKNYVYTKNLKEINKYSEEIKINLSGKSFTESLYNFENENEGLEAIISLQGKIGLNKKLVGDTLYCYDTCSINFDGSESSGEIVKYLWDFGNGIKFEGKNPGYVKYLNYGNYNVSLTLIGINYELVTKNFNIIFSKKLAKKVIKKDNLKDNYLMVNVSDAGNSEILNTENENNNGILIYLIIIVLSIFLLFLILRKEKLI